MTLLDRREQSSKRQDPGMEISFVLSCGTPLSVVLIGNVYKPTTRSAEFADMGVVGKQACP